MGVCEWTKIGTDTKLVESSGNTNDAVYTDAGDKN